MAVTVGQLAQAVGTTSAASFYARPASTQVSAYIRIVNTTATDRWASVFNDDNSTTATDATAILHEVDVPANGFITVSGILMNTASGTIYIQAEANTALTFTMYGTLTT